MTDLAPHRELAAADEIARFRLDRHFGDAWGRLEEALRRFPDSTRLVYERGMLHFDQKRHSLAIADFDYVLAAEGDHEDAMVWRFVARADALRMQRRFARAEKVLAEALDRFPRSEHLVNQRGLVHYDQKRYDEAISDFENALSVQPDSDFAREWCFLARATRGRTRRRFEEAARTIEEGLRRFPRSAHLLSERGWLNMDQEHFDRAKDDFDVALHHARDLTHVQFNEVELLVRTGRVNEALEHLDQLKEQDPDDLLVRERLGWLQLERHDPDAAAAEFDHMVRQDPKNMAGVAGQGAVLFHQGSYSEAEEKFRPVLAEAPEDPIFQTKLAWSLVRQEAPSDVEETKKRLAEAEALCRRALTRDPNRAQTLGCLGIIAFQRGRVRESLDYLRRSIAVAPTEGHYADLGALYVQLGRYEEAEDVLKKGIVVDEYDARTHIELGNLYLQSDRLRDAVRTFRRATLIDTQSDEAKNALAVALMESGNWGEAERVLREGIRTLDEPRRWRLHLTLARLLTTLGDETNEPVLYEQALREVSQAIRIHPKNPDAYFHKGVVRSKLGDYRGSLHSFKKCMSEGGDHSSNAERYAQRVRNMLREHPTLSRARTFLLIAFAAQLVAAWVLRIREELSETLFTALVPILLGLLVVVFVLPSLARLKLPGLEADLSQPKEKDMLSSGPTGDVGFHSSVPIISTGPR